MLFLDEPTAGVDPEGRLAVRSIIAAQRDRGICVILTTHELAEAERLADQVIIIDQGRILAEGSPSSLASGSADGSIRFTAAPGIDTSMLLEALDGAIGGAATLIEERPGSYRLTPPVGAPTPAVIAALAGWLAERDLALGDLRTGRSLEEAYLAITGSGGDVDPPDDGSGGGTRSVNDESAGDEAAGDEPAGHEDSRSTGRGRRSGRSGRSGRMRHRSRDGRR